MRVQSNADCVIVKTLEEPIIPSDYKSYFTAEYAELAEKGFNYSGLKPGIKDFDFTLRPPRSLR
jgi:hypothetical protein